MERLQWFPGHMTAAMRMMEENLRNVDGVIVVLDARAPFASLNKKFDDLFKNKKVIYALNKKDLVSEEQIRSATARLKAEGRAALPVCANDKKSVDRLYNAIFETLKDKIERYKAKNMVKPVRIMVVGIPNTGKSSLINAVAGGKKTVTGNKAGVTKGKQWVKIKDAELLDTPGTMPPAFSDQTLAKHLAFIGSMNDGNLDFSDLAAEFIAEMQQKYPDNLFERYGITADMGVLEAFDTVCVKRGFLLKGNDKDYDRCAQSIIDDFRKGRLDKIMLD